MWRVQPPSDETVLALSGWDPREARVLVISAADDVALATVGRAEDGEYLDAVELQWQEGSGWRCQSFSGRSDVVSAGGCIAPAVAERVTLEFRGRRVEVPVASNGWWAYVAKVDADSLRQRPRVRVVSGS